MDGLKQCEFFLLRYQPDGLTGEFANIGIVLLEGKEAPPRAAAMDVAQPTSTGRNGVHVRFTHDWRRVRCLDPDADLAVLEELESDLREQLIAGAWPREMLVSKLQDYCSNALQLSPVTGCLAEDPAREIETLARLYLERSARHGARVSARHAIAGQMRDAFERAGVWGRMLKKIAAADYTFAGDPLKLDCGYTVERGPSAVRLFHAVSLSSDVDTAKVLAFSFPQLREGIAQKEHRRAELTAITEDGLDANDPAIAFALATLQRSEIAVATVASLPAIAEQARTELRP